MFEQMGEGEVKTLPLIIKADVQGSYEGLAHSLAQAVHRRSQGQRHPQRRRRDHRIRRQPGAGLQGGRHRLQCARRRGGAQAGRDQRRRHPLLQHHLRSGRRREGGAVRHARAGEARKASSASSRSARCSRSPRSAPSPAAMCSTAWSSAARACACCATTW